jgi:hypothetical protein
MQIPPIKGLAGNPGMACSFCDDLGGIIGHLLPTTLLGCIYPLRQEKTKKQVKGLSVNRNPRAVNKFFLTSDLIKYISSMN